VTIFINLSFSLFVYRPPINFKTFYHGGLFHVKHTETGYIFQSL